MQGQGRLIVTSFYKSKAWRMARDSYLKENPLCVKCKEEGKITLATVVDHKIQINRMNPYDTQDGRYPDPLDRSNFQSMCLSHHNQKSAMERHGKKSDQ